MKHSALVLLGAACVLALGLAYGIGRVHGRGARFDASLASSETGQPGSPGRFWRFGLELATGSEAADRVDPAEALVPSARREARFLDPLPQVIVAPRAEEARPTLASTPQEQPLRKSLVSGPLLEGWYENGQLHFRGTQVGTQDGEWLREGGWEAWHENGALHELGSYAGDVEQGEWKWFHENGARMAEGRFDAGRKVGAWLFWHENGRQMMEGAYVDGKRDGRWVFHHANGVRAGQGSYAAGEAVGEWTFWLEDGTVDVERTGLYERGERVR